MRRHYDKLSIQLSSHLLQPPTYKENSNVLLLVLKTKLNWVNKKEVFNKPVTIFWNFDLDLIRRSDWNLETLIFVNEKPISSVISLTKEANTVIWIFPVLFDNLAVLNVIIGFLVEDSIDIRL